MLDKRLSPKQLMVEFDPRRKGEVSRKDFRSGVKRTLVSTATDRELDELFNHIDSKGTGALEVGALQTELCRFHERVVELAKGGRLREVKRAKLLEHHPLLLDAIARTAEVEAEVEAEKAEAAEGSAARGLVGTASHQAKLAAALAQQALAAHQDALVEALALAEEEEEEREKQKASATAKAKAGWRSVKDSMKDGTLEAQARANLAVFREEVQAEAWAAAHHEALGEALAQAQTPAEGASPESQASTLPSSSPIRRRASIASFDRASIAAFEPSPGGRRASIASLEPPSLAAGRRASIASTFEALPGGRRASMASLEPLSAAAGQRASVQGAPTGEASPAPLPLYPKEQATRALLISGCKKSALFRGSSKEAVAAAVDAMLPVDEVALGADVITQGDSKDDQFYVVESGEYTVHLKQARDAEVHRYAAGSTFGELALMYSCPRAATVRCAVPGQLWTLDRKAYRLLMKSRVSKSDRQGGDARTANGSPTGEKATNGSFTRGSPSSQRATNGSLTRGSPSSQRAADGSLIRGSPSPERVASAAASATVEQVDTRGDHRGPWRKSGNS